MGRRINIRRAAVIAAMLGGSAGASQPSAFGPADPIVKDPAAFDAKRLIERDLGTNVPDGFLMGAVGDLIISRPLSQDAARLPAFQAVLDVLGRGDVLYGNLETTIFDARSFTGAPYSWDGDWTNSALPGVARDLRKMGFDIVSEANNHALDWGIEGMRETGRWLDQAGITHAGTGETRGQARAPRYLERPAGRVALVSFATSFRPTTEALPSEGAAPARPGLSALHLARIVEVPPSAMAALARTNCVLFKQSCGEPPQELTLFDTRYRLATAFSYEYSMDPEDLAEIHRSIREARENADFVIVSVHSHECSRNCDDDAPRGAANFLKQLAHDAIDSGADIFVTTGNHNLGPVEVYDSPGRGKRPIFYGLGDFFWSDIQEPLPHDLFQENRELLARAWTDPGKATEYDLTAPLNKESFAHDYTFQTVIAECRFDRNQLSRIELYPVEAGYGSRLTESGIPRLVTDASEAGRIFKQIIDQTASFDLPKLALVQSRNLATITP